MNNPEIINSYTKDIKDYLYKGLVTSQSNGSYGKDLLSHFEMMADYFKEIKEIENEIGIDLITLFKAFRQDKIFIKPSEPYYGDKVSFCNSFSLGLFRHNYGLHCRYGIIYERNEFVYLKDYGKTWALTKEELE